MSNFEVKIRLELLAGGYQLVKQGKEKQLPEMELNSGVVWREEVEGFVARTLGELVGHVELVDAETGLDGLFPVLTLLVRVYLPSRPSSHDKSYRWARAEQSNQKTESTGGELDKSSMVILYTDGGSRGNPGPAGTGAVLMQEATGWSEDYCRFIGDATNNYAEYTALLDGLRLALQRGISKLEHRSDSQLLVRQLEGSYKVKSPDLKVLFDEAKTLISSFESFRTVHVPREQNKLADELANRAMDEAGAKEV